MTTTSWADCLANAAPITSTKTAVYREIKALDFAGQSGTLRLEGLHPLEEALKADRDITHLLLTPQASTLQDLSPALAVKLVNTPCFTLSSDLMTGLQSSKTPLPILALSPAAVPEPCPPSGGVLVLAGLQDPGNLGNLIRTAAAFNLQAIWICGPNALSAYHAKVIRASAGLVFRLPLNHFSSLSEAVTTAHQLTPQTPWLITACADTTPLPTSYTQLSPLPPNYFLCLGNESHGLSGPHVFPNPTLVPLLPLTIPMAPDVDSLNVASAGAILMAHFANVQQD